MIGASTVDHIGIPVVDLDRADDFYVNTLGLTFQTRRKNADGSPRHTYVVAGENIVGLCLPGIHTEPSASGAPRYGIALDSEDRFQDTVGRIQAYGVPNSGIEEFASGSPFIRSFRFDDPDHNHMEVCLRRGDLGGICLSHVIFETTDMARATLFYTEALGLEPSGTERGERLFGCKSGQLIGLKEVEALSDRTRKHGRAVHVAFDVTHEDFDAMVDLIQKLEGRSMGDHRADDGLRAPGERSLFFFDPDTNHLQITAQGTEDWTLLPDEEKWKRIKSNREKRGRGISSFDAGKRSGSAS
jgi:catechol 2,3-dioxygenase-like lactoylglutathione lyase family enzyme